MTIYMIYMPGESPTIKNLGWPWDGRPHLAPARTPTAPPPNHNHWMQVESLLTSGPETVVLKTMP